MQTVSPLDDKEELAEYSTCFCQKQIMSQYTIIVEEGPLERLLMSALETLREAPEVLFKRSGDTIVIQSTRNGKPAGDSPATTSERFEVLFQRWKKETALLSSGTAIVGHPAYQEVIEMGDAVVPFILIKLQEDPQHLFYALYKITGENPVPKAHAGDLDSMTADWLDWGRQKGYLD
jgi:hypothetical protein